MARAPVSKTGGWGFEVPPLLPQLKITFDIVRFLAMCPSPPS